MRPSWYDVLGVEPTATVEEIRSAWRAGIADLEPGAARFRVLNEAAEVLLDPQARAAYDARLGASEAAPAPLATRQVGEEVGEQEGEGDRVPWPPVPLVPGWLLAVLAVGAVAALAAATWTWQRTSAESVQEAARAAQTAAEQAIVPVLSYDYETLEADQQRARSYLTSDYREDYDQLFGVISDNAPSTKTTVSAEVIASGIVRAAQDRVQVLVFVDRPTTNKVTPEPVVYKDQVTVTMEKVGEDWLVDDLLTSPVQN